MRITITPVPEEFEAEDPFEEFIDSQFPVGTRVRVSASGVVWDGTVESIDAEEIPSHLRLSFTAAAIREHYEDGDEDDNPTAGLSDEDLNTVGEWALSDDILYREFHRALESALEEFKLKKEN